MGNKGSTPRKDSEDSGEIRGRSRSFNGLTSRFRRGRSKSPPRERSSSFTETRPPKRGSFRTSSQNGFLRSGKDKDKTPHSSPTKPVSIRSCVKPIVEDESAKNLSTSLPSRSRHFPPPLDPPTITFIDSNVKDTLGRDTLRRALTRKESESPRLSARNVRQISQDLLGEKLAGIAKRRGLAVQNRDLSLSQASLSRLSCKSKSLHSLGSVDIDNEVENDSKESKYGKIVLRQNIGVSPPSENYIEKCADNSFRSRTNSAPAIDLIKRDTKGGDKSYSDGPQSKAVSHRHSVEGQRSGVVGHQRSPEEVVQARRMLVFRALKTENEDLEPPDRKSIPVLMDRKTSPGRAKSPSQRSNRSVSPVQKQSGAVSPVHPSVSPVSIPESPTSDKSHSPGRKGQSPSNQRSSSPDLQNPIVSSETRRNSSPNLFTSPKEISAVQKSDKCNRPTPVKASPTKRPLPNIDEYKILGSGGAKGRAEVWGSYESLTMRSQKNDDVADDDSANLRERSHSVSFTQPGQVVENKSSPGQPVEPNLCISPLETLETDYSHSSFRGRSCSLSVLRERAKMPSMGTTSAFIQQKPMNRLWSYSVTSLSEMGLDHSVQSREHKRFLDEIRGNAGMCLIMYNFPHFIVFLRRNREIISLTLVCKVASMLILSCKSYVTSLKHVLDENNTRTRDIRNRDLCGIVAIRVRVSD